MEMNTEEKMAVEMDEATRLKAEKLFEQAQIVRRMTGMDVLALFSQNEMVRQKVTSGEWDMVDVYEHVRQSSGSAAAAPETPEASQNAPAPAPVRSANGSLHAGAPDVRRMSDKEFEKLNKALAKGVSVQM